VSTFGDADARCNADRGPYDRLISFTRKITQEKRGLDVLDTCVQGITWGNRRFPHSVLQSVRTGSLTREGANARVSVVPTRDALPNRALKANT
jgi:hypothetical protein